MYKAKRLKHEEAAPPSQRKNDFVRTVVVRWSWKAETILIVMLRRIK